MHGGRYAGNYGNVIWIGEAWHRIHSDRGEAFRHQPLEVGKDVLRQTCMYIGWITTVDEDYHDGRPRPLIGLAVHLDLLWMILRGDFGAREQQPQAGGRCKGESSSHCRAPVRDLLQSNYWAWRVPAHAEGVWFQPPADSISNACSKEGKEGRRPQLRKPPGVQTDGFHALELTVLTARILAQSPHGGKAKRWTITESCWMLRMQFSENSKGGSNEQRSCS